MNLFDTSGSLLIARDEMTRRHAAAALQRLIRCCREVVSWRTRIAGFSARFHPGTRAVMPSADCVAC